MEGNESYAVGQRRSKNVIEERVPGGIPVNSTLCGDRPRAGLSPHHSKLGHRFYKVLYRVALAFENRQYFAKQLPVSKYLNSCLENTAVSFLLYEHPGNTEEEHLSLHPSRYDFILLKHTFF